MDDYISREAAIELIDNAPIIAGNENETLISAPKLSDKVYCLPAADVRPVAEISDAVDEVLDFLNENYNRMPYHIYSALFDLVCGICPNCGADMEKMITGKEENGRT